MDDFFIPSIRLSARELLELSQSDCLRLYRKCQPKEQMKVKVWGGDAVKSLTKNAQINFELILQEGRKPKAYTTKG